MRAEGGAQIDTSKYRGIVAAKHAVKPLVSTRPVDSAPACDPIAAVSHKRNSAGCDRVVRRTRDWESAEYPGHECSMAGTRHGQEALQYEVSYWATAAFKLAVEVAIGRVESPSFDHPLRAARGSADSGLGGKR
jgi:hypothetical protein